MSQLPYRDYAALQFGSPFQIAAYWVGWALFLFPVSLVFRLRPGARRQVPRERPFLLLANHTSLFDPLWAAYWVGKRCSFMGSEVIFSKPILRWLAPLGGCFPKAFAVKDRSAMAKLTTRYEAGSPVVIFPEGARSYDGRALEVLPGIGRTVKRMDAEVVVARIETGHLFHPRWAKLPRWVPVRVTHETLPRFAEDATPEQVTEFIRQKMAIDHEVVAPKLSFGIGMALGLPDYLWACPTCFELECLEATGVLRNRVKCTSCGDCWRLDTSNRLHGAHETLRVHEAHDRVLAHFGEAPRAQNHASADADTLLSQSCAGVRLIRRGHRPTTLAKGNLRLSQRGLHVDSEAETLWSVALQDISRVSMAFGDTVTLRVHDQLIGLELGEGNAALWHHFTAAWHARAQGERRLAA